MARRIAGPREWLSLAAIVFLLAAAVGWAFDGSLATKVPAHGLITRPGGIVSVAAPGSGLVMKLNVTPGDLVQANQTIAQIAQPGSNEKTSDAIAPYAGRIIELKVYRGSPVSAGTPIASIEAEDGALEVIGYISALQAQNVRPGMEAQIAPGTVRREEYGFMRGRVKFVGAYPATPAAMMNVPGNESLMQSISAGGPVTEVHIEPEKAATPSGFLWSSRNGPPMRISSGTICTVQIVTGHTQPISKVLPAMKDQLGLN